MSATIYFASVVSCVAGGVIVMLYYEIFDARKKYSKNQYELYKHNLSEYGKELKDRTEKIFHHEQLLCRITQEIQEHFKKQPPLHIKVSTGNTQDNTQDFK